MLITSEVLFLGNLWYMASQKARSIPLKQYLKLSMKYSPVFHIHGTASPNRKIIYIKKRVQLGANPTDCCLLFSVQISLQRSSRGIVEEANNTDSSTQKPEENVEEISSDEEFLGRIQTMLTHFEKI